MAGPLIPKLELSRFSKIPCSMVSKAALRSKATSTVGLPESEAVKILFKVRSRDVSVEYEGL